MFKSQFDNLLVQSLRKFEVSRYVFSSAVFVSHAVSKFPWVSQAWNIQVSQSECQVIFLQVICPPYGVGDQEKKSVD